MATNKLTKGGAAGGPGSRQVVQKPQRLGQPASGVSPGWASQLGAGISDHITNKSSTGYRGEKMMDGKVPGGGNQRLGNAVAASTVCGPGGSRTVHSCGSQTGVSPTKSPNASTRDTLAEFGPDSANARNKR
jgi:hypothetical protein